MYRFKNHVCHFGALGLLLVVAGCAEPEVPKRHYQEFIIEAPPPVDHHHHHHDHAHEMTGADLPADHVHGEMRDMPMPMQRRPEQASTFEWDTPSDWREEPGAGMRLATLWVSGNGEEAECTLIVLGGDAGGLQANIVRWMEQVQIQPPMGYEMQNYLDELEEFTTAGGDRGVLIDFAPFVAEPDQLSTLAAIIERGRESLYIKLTGSRALLEQERSAFDQLARSIR